ncbi:MAG: dethiobiotin synthase, partial [Planctomycetota bacterium]
GCHRSWEGPVSHDTEFLSYCANSDLSLAAITPAAYLTEAEPVVSSARERKPIDFERIADAYNEICEHSDIVIVEGIGGVRVPLTTEFDLLDLAVEFGLPVVIVARARAGMINHTLMTTDCVRAAKLKIAGVVINGFNATESTMVDETAEEVISHCGGVDILSVVPFDETVDIQEPSLGEFIIPTLAECGWAKLARI